jgi:hypothetical protein
MRGKILLLVRRVHLYLSVFFAPLLLLFVVTGWAQTMDFDHSSAFLGRLSQVHTRQFYPVGPATTDARGEIRVPGGKEESGYTVPMKWLVAAMSVALIISILLGLVLAFSMARLRFPSLIALILGVGIPFVLLALAHRR